MSDIENGGSMATSEAFKALSDQFQQAGGSAESLETILWMIGGHPELLGHRRVFRHLNELLRSNVFSADSLYWASAWRHDVPAWIDALTRIESLAHSLREIPVLQLMCKEPRHERDHLLLRHGVTRHPIPAALFNQYQGGAAQSPGSAEARYQTMRAHVVAMYFESRWRAAQGRDEFMRHTGNKEFARVPVGAGPVGLCLREFSLLDYMPLLLQLPEHACTVDFAYALSALQPNFASLPRERRHDAARYFTDLQRYLNALPMLLNASELQPRNRKGTGFEGGDGAHPLHPGWVGWTGGTIHRQLDLDWADDAPPVTRVSLPAAGELDATEEELEGDCPGATRDSSIELYDAVDAVKVMSRMRFRRLALELRQAPFLWSLDVASQIDRHRTLHVARERIDRYLLGDTKNQTKARLQAIGGALARAATLYGWTPELTAEIAVRQIDALDAQTVESLAYIRQDHIVVLATRGSEDGVDWVAQAFLVPAVSPRYASQLPDQTVASGRLRQTSFLLPDVGGLAGDLLAIAQRSGRLQKDSAVQRRLLGVEGKTARNLARDCVAEAADPACDDARARLTVGRLIAGMRAVLAHVSGDLVPSWMISYDTSRTSEARLHYTQVRASNLAHWHAQALAWLHGVDDPAKQSTQDIGELQSGWVGCRHVADLVQVRRLVDDLQADASAAPDLERRSEIRRYHNDFTLLAWLHQALPLGLRPTADGPSLNHQYELRRGLNHLPAHDAAAVVDKHHAFQDKARLIPISQFWALGAERLERHNAAVIQRLDLFAEWQQLDAVSQRMFAIADNETLVPVTPSWIKTRLLERGFSLPPNFGRSLLRTEWLDQKCNGRIVDALLGHFDHGQNWFSKHSSHEPLAYLVAVENRLPAYIEHLHLKPQSSLCVPAGEREGHFDSRVHLPSTGLKTPPPRQRSRPIWFDCDVAPAMPEAQTAIWSEVARHAARGDRRELIGLLWTLRNSTNAHAKLLTGRPLDREEVADELSARQIENELLFTMQRHTLPRTIIGSWLRLLLSAERRLQAQGTPLPATMVAALCSPPDSPISPMCMTRLPDLATWRAALYEWTRLRGQNVDDDWRYWAIAIALSAVVHGMVLDSLLLSRILQQLAEPGPRRLLLCGGADGHSFMTFSLPSDTPGGVQLTRWFLDPLTELLVLRAPPFPSVPTLRSTARDLNRFLHHHGAPLHRCPGGWRVVMKTARAFWSTRVSQHVVQVAQRGTSTTSLLTPCWNRLFGAWELSSRRPGALPLETAASQPSLTLDDLAPSEEEDDQAVFSSYADRQAAISGASSTAGADFDHTTQDVRSAQPWMQAAWDALAPGTEDPVARLNDLRHANTSDGFRKGALEWLIRTTVALQLDAKAGEGDVLIGLRRVISTLLPRLSAELRGQWLNALKPKAQADALAAMAHELETGASRQDLRRGVELLRRFEPSLAPEASQVGPMAGHDGEEPDPEEGDLDSKVDSRILTVDEYLRAAEAIRTGIDPPLTTEEREILQDMLDLGTWSMARPREYMEARLGDFHEHLGQLAMVVREYEGHSLKTSQAVRMVPLSILAPAHVVERLIARLRRRRNECVGRAPAEAHRCLLFPPPPGATSREHHDRLLRLLRQVLRRVTGDSGFRVYGLRHSGANWLLLALASDGSALWNHLWANQPEMAAWLRNSTALRQRLLGSDDRTDRRALLAITKIQGHLAAATSFLHYLHLSSLLQLQAVLQLADGMPVAVMADAAGIAPSTYSDQRAEGWRNLLCKARARGDWTAKDARGPDAPDTLEKMEGDWLSFEELAQMFSAHAFHQQPLDAIAMADDNYLGRSTTTILAGRG